MIKTAVLLSLYNNDSSKHYKDCLESLLHQKSLENVELRIYQAIDGPISEPLEAVVSEYQPRIYKIVRHEQNRGLSVALNSLIDSLEDEEYVFRMDSDDISRPDRIEQQVAFMEAHKDIGISGTSISEFDESGKTTLRSYPLTHEKLLANMPKVSPFAHPTVCFRRSALKMLGQYSTRYHLCEDIELWFRAAKMGIKFANIPVVGLDFRIQKNFFKRRSMSKAISEFQVYWNGSLELFGFSPALVFPFLRLASRLMPTYIIKFFYKHSVRNKFLNG